ncbi:MAG TPA: glycosyltransferase family 2 protein [Candidatus Marinimicrobia bacterium]|nr:glycosyltransferase family 2 protein [Candidatus Neomarinimicrobiota bacterium]
MKRVSVIIPHYNGEQILRECLKSLRKTRYPNLEIIVVDNHSSDNSVAMLRSEFPEMLILTMSENYGFAGACNYGIETASGDYLLILNNDTIHKSDFIHKLAAYLDEHPHVASVMPKILSYHQKEYFDYSGASGGMMDQYGYPFARGRIMEDIEKDLGQHNKPMNVFWCSGTAFLIRRSVLKEIGLFDMLFFAHMEEIDLHWRLYLRGYKAAVLPSAVVWHHSGWTLPPDAYLKKYLNHRNNLIMILANYSGANLLRFGIPRLLLELLSSFYAIFRRDVRRFAAVYAALFWIIRHPMLVLSKRRKSQALRKRSDAEIMPFLYPRSIALDYYLKKKKNWKKIAPYFKGN